MLLRTTASVFALIVALTACGGAGSAAPPVGGKTASEGSATFSIAVPKRTTPTARRGQYVPSNAQSASVAVNGGAPTVLTLTAQSPSCTSVTSGLRCTVSVTAPFGNDSFSVSVFASTDGSGNALATQTVTANVSSTAPTSVSLTLGGIIASLAVALSNPTPSEGTASNITLTVTATDASGATILGTDAFATAVTIADNDTSGATSLSATSITSPANGSITVHYTGAHATVATFTATAGNASAHATLTSVAPTPTPSPSASPANIWVANNGGASVLAFNAAARQTGGNVAPAITVSGANTLFTTYSPQCIRFDAGGNMIVVGSYGSNSPGAILVFSNPSAGGNLPPLSTISGTNTNLTTPVGCTLDLAGNLWLVNDDNYAYSVEMFSAAQLSTGGNVAPTRVISPVTCCGNSSLCNTVSMAFDGGGNLWTGSLCAPTAEFSAASIASSGSPTPIGYFGQSGGANGVAFDSAGNLWTAIGSSVTEFNAASLPNASSGSLSANVTISGTNTQIANANGLAFDSSGNLWVSDSSSGSLLEFSASSLSTGGNIAPSVVIRGATTTLSSPNGLTFHP